MTTALDRIIKSQALISKKLTVPCVEAEELPAALPQSLTEELNDLSEHRDTPSPSVTYSGLVYVARYIAKLICDFECDACSILLKTHERSDPLYTLLESHDFSRLHYLKEGFVALLRQNCVLFRESCRAPTTYKCAGRATNPHSATS